ncbi:MAG: RDD family protein [Eubacteriales bacterium]|nr:RDD family protein [Eubacteriales bacterium]
MIFKKRLFAFIIDYMFLIIVFVIVNIPQIYVDYVLNGNFFTKAYYITYYIVLSSAFAAYICKDVIHGKSIGKRLMKIKVLNQKGENPHIWQLIIRNITILIWPIEFILFALDKRRIGDIIAKTNVVIGE